MKNIKLYSEKPIAYDSPDHLEPHGTRRDNSRNLAFNKKLYNLMGEHKELKILDLGCSGGLFVKDCLDHGHIAFGIDGSDYSKRHKRAEWRTIPDNLKTADITKQFFFYDDTDQRVLFDVITLWDVIEHIKKGDLPNVLENLKSNLSYGGIIIMSVGCIPDVINGVKLHQTVMPEGWWRELFSNHNLFELAEHKDYFGNQFIKGKANYESGFVIVLSKDLDFIPEVPQRTMIEKFFDVWAGSKPQIYLNKLVNGYSDGI